MTTELVILGANTFISGAALIAVGKVLINIGEFKGTTFTKLERIEQDIRDLWSKINQIEDV